MNAPDWAQQRLSQSSSKNGQHVDSGDLLGAAVMRGHAALEVQGFAASAITRRARRRSRPSGPAAIRLSLPSLATDPLFTIHNRAIEQARRCAEAFLE
jgi:hypothetical protein